MGMPEECVELMAAQGAAYVPTLTAFARSAATRIKDNPRSRLWHEGHRIMIRRVREAHDAGITVLAGTDSAPFGNVATEVEHLVAAGLPAAVAVGAASWAARDFLGLPGLVEGGLADVTVYDADPRLEPGCCGTLGGWCCGGGSCGETARNGRRARVVVPHFREWSIGRSVISRSPRGTTPSTPGGRVTTSTSGM